MIRMLNRADCCRQANESGFTLIELMVSMVMGLIIIAGITMMFISYSRTSNAVSLRTERMGDLYLATQIMLADLRESMQVTGPAARPADLAARGVSLPSGYPVTFTSGLPYWDAVTKTMTYQDQDGSTGIFQYQRTSNDRIYWLRPDITVSSFAELIRDLDITNGMTATLAANVWTVTLNSSYSDEKHKGKNMTISFKTWPRN
jgi:prepilin-type N-terminal cleavage/methylation domain-containing protein